MVDQLATASALVFPCHFPIKAMGACQDNFAQEIAAVVVEYIPDFDPATIEMTASSRGNYLSLTCSVYVSSQQQLDGLYRALSSHPMVKVVL